MGLDGGEHDAANMCAQGEVAEDRSDLLRCSFSYVVFGVMPHLYRNTTSTGFGVILSRATEALCELVPCSACTYFTGTWRQTACTAFIGAAGCKIRATSLRLWKSFMIPNDTLIGSANKICGKNEMHCCSPRRQVFVVGDLRLLLVHSVSFE